MGLGKCDVVDVSTMLSFVCMWMFCVVFIKDTIKSLKNGK